MTKIADANNHRPSEDIILETARTLYIGYKRVHTWFANYRNIRKRQAKRHAKRVFPKPTINKRKDTYNLADTTQASKRARLVAPPGEQLPPRDNPSQNSPDAQTALQQTPAAGTAQTAEYQASEISPTRTSPPPASAAEAPPESTQNRDVYIIQASQTIPTQNSSGSRAEVVNQPQTAPASQRVPDREVAFYNLILSLYPQLTYSHYLTIAVMFRATDVYNEPGFRALKARVDCSYAKTVPDWYKTWQLIDHFYKYKPNATFHEKVGFCHSFKIEHELLRKRYKSGQ